MEANSPCRSDLRWRTIHTPQELDRLCFLLIIYLFIFRHKVLEILHDTEDGLKNIIDLGHKFEVTICTSIIYHRWTYFSD